MKKQRFFRSITLAIVMLMSLSYIVRAQERRVPETVTFNFEDCPVIGELEDVSFDANKIAIHRDFTPHVQFVSPEWLKGRNEQYPVGYQAGDTPKIKAKFVVTCSKILETPDATVKIQGICSDGTSFPPVDCIVSNSFATYPETAIKTLAAGKVAYSEHLTTTWQIQNSKNEWIAAGKSDNRLYVPLSRTIKGCNIADGETRVFYSSLHYACEPADGLTDLDKIAEAIYNRFKTRHVPRIDNPTLAGIDGMKYWGAINPLKNGCRGLAGLLNYEDAACGEWRRFLQHCFAQHDIKGCRSIMDARWPTQQLQQTCASQYQTIFKKPIPGGDAVFLVKSWEIPKLNEFYVVAKKWPYTTIQKSFTSSGVIIPVGDNMGDLAQNMTDPETFFTNHGTVCLKGKIYDPSYGTGPFDDIFDWEKKSIDAYALSTFIIDSKGEKIHLVYPYEMEIDDTQQVNHTCN